MSTILSKKSRSVGHSRGDYKKENQRSWFTAEIIELVAALDCGRTYGHPEDTNAIIPSVFAIARDLRWGTFT